MGFHALRHDKSTPKSSEDDMKLRNPETAFQSAIDKGHLNITPESIFFAGNYMYMYSDDTCDFFKNIESRQYLKVSQTT